MKKNLLILMWHQVYLSTKAGGYIRLIEFLKRTPKDVYYTILDNSPTIFNDVVPKESLLVYKMPKVLDKIRENSFLIWGFLEVPIAGYILYQQAQKIILENEIKVLYVPIGEFPQLYIPAIFLKKKFPQINLIVDILNYELPQNSAFSYYRQLRKGKISFIKSVIIVVMFYVGYFLTNLTIRNVDYIFTVSERLVKEIKKKYQKKSINFTPSGVVTDFPISLNSKREYDAIYVGRITIQKGIDELLQVWKLVVTTKPKAVLAIVGYADKQLEHEIKKEIKNNKLQKNITLFGGVSEDMKNRILSKSTLFLHLAKYEPLFPVIGILEGFSHGLPVVVYDMDVIPGEIKKSNTPFITIVPNGDQKAVVTTVINFMNTKKPEKEILYKQAKNYSRNYSWDVIAKKEFDVIRKYIYKH
jgi:glycosyltransferase involved in cell wall biosynthesis